MAEMGKGVTAGKLASNVQKKLTRAQEKVLQKLGKADETRDTAFEETLSNFNKQMVEGSKLQRDLKAYLAAVKTMHEASRRLQDCLADMYDPEWFGKEEVDSMAEDTDVLWTEYTQTLVDNSVITVDTYLAQFPEIKTRIAKRERKMVDFDSARHHFASVQKGKKKDEAKIAKAEEELGRSQKVFEELNVELQDELPQLWDNRVGVYVVTFQSLAGQQEKFHREMGKLSHNLNDIMTKLDEQRAARKGGKALVKSEGANHSVTPDSTPKLRPGPPPSRPPPRPSLTPTPTQDLRQDSIINMFAEVQAPHPTSATSPAATPQAPSWDSWQPEQTAAAEEPQGGRTEGEDQRGLDGESQLAPQAYAQPSWDDAGHPSWGDDPATAQSHSQPGWDQEEEGGWGPEGGAQAGESAARGWGDDSEELPEWEQSTEVAEAATKAVTNGSEEADRPPGFIYKVKAMHDYAATDGDELEMKSGDVVLVVAIDNPDEQDDGWLMGMKESDWLDNKGAAAKGVFPENFTQKL